MTLAISSFVISARRETTTVQSRCRCLGNRKEWRRYRFALRRGARLSLVPEEQLNDVATGQSPEWALVM